jgi:putative transposase
MLFLLLYMVLRAVFRLALAGEQRDREIEILVLRHELQVLKRKAGRPKLRRRDRLFLAAAARLLPKERWSCFMISPATLLGWHRQLVKRQWTYRSRRTGRGVMNRRFGTSQALAGKLGVATAGPSQAAAAGSLKRYSRKVILEGTT